MLAVEATLPPLPYEYNALEPFISAEIMTLHHSKHHQTYINNLNAAIEQAAAELADDGRAVIGFGAGREYEFSQFFDDATAAGLTPDLLLSTWDLRPFAEDSDFLVAILRRA